MYKMYSFMVIKTTTLLLNVFILSMSISVCCYSTGGGLGGTRRGAPNENIKYSGRVDER